MFMPRTNLCPLLRAECAGASCRFWTHVRGLNPQTGQEIDKFGCAVEFLPMLLIENSAQQRSTGAAVESFRNEMVRGNDATLRALLQAPQVKMIEG
jgi:hypothetical protein